jgi:type I restriction enzyme R subunit
MNATGQATSSNFGFLSKRYPQLERLGALGERYFSDDPVVSLIRVRQFGEVLAQLVAARSGLFADADEPQADLLRRLRIDASYPRNVLDLFHQLRIAGNAATHHNEGDHATALGCLKMARQLGIWFYRTFDDQRFKPGPFQPPRPPIDATAELTAELGRLRAERDTALSEVQRAKAAAEDAEAARLTAETGAKGAAKERALWEQLAAEAEAAKNQLAQQLASLQAAAVASPPAEQQQVLQLALSAAEAISLDEADTRALIDQQLRDSGWGADTKELRYASGARPVKGRNLAIAEWPTATGPADYALFVGLTLVGVAEAKRRRKNVSAAIDQAERYSTGIGASADFAFAGGPWGEHKVPFVFAANGRSYLKQIETESGIWFRDNRRTANIRRALASWPTPQGLTGELEIDRDAATATLQEMPFGFGFPLREYQKAAIKAVEEALAAGRRSMLLAMATGTGKTKVSIALLYRVLAAKRFRRICFVVDRSALGDQAAGEFSTTKIIAGRAFADIFGLKRLQDVEPETETKVHICTIQGLVRRVLYAADTSEAPPIDQYDLVVVDECHRGYLLDREMSDAELSFRGQEDYISKYRRVLEYFDAVKIGLTATPALHTTEIFGDPIFTYSYRQAVIDGYLIDHEPPVRIETALARAGIVFEKDEPMDLLDTTTGKINLTHAPDEIRFEVEKFNKQVVTTEFNRVVAEELANHIDPALPGKTLIFAVSDAHADIVVNEIKRAFATKYGDIDDAAVKKITGSVDRVRNLILSFKNDANPKIAVTVDLLTTGVDVLSITNLVFLRRVNSRILYEQMIGRATRLCPEIDKEVFLIFDAVDLYPHLENLTTMKPVVVNPSIRFEKLITELARAKHDEHRESLRQQLIVKLRRSLKRLSDEARASYEAVARETPEATLKRLLEDKPSELSNWFSSRLAVGPILDWQSEAGAPHFMPISHHEDQLVAVTRGYGEATKPEDFLEGFAAYVRDNINTLAALKLVVQRPRDLTRADLREVRSALDLKGYSEANLRRAWADAKNVDIAASIIGFVRQAALGDPLIPYADRVKAAVQRVLASRAWSDPQKRWLRRIGEQIEKEIVVDREALDREPFAADGGFVRLNKVFDGELEAVLTGLNEEMWKRTG